MFYFTSATAIRQLLEVLHYVCDENIDVTGMGKEYWRKEGWRYRYERVKEKNEGVRNKNTN
jgi:hypothetical protein